MINSRENLERRLEVWRERMESVRVKLSVSKTEYLSSVGKDGNNLDEKV